MTAPNTPPSAPGGRAGEPPVRNQEIIYLTVKALFHICDGNQLNRMKISFSGAADFLMTCLTKYPDEDKMVDFVLGIMIGMGFDKVGQSRLGTVGMCKHVGQLITKYEKTSDYLTVLSVCLVGTLARNSKSNQEKLGLTQVHRLIIPLLQKAVTSAANTSSATTSPTNAATSSGFLSKTISSLRRNSILPPSTSSPPNSPDAAMIEALTNANNLADTSGVATSESEESQSPNVSLSEYIGDFSLAKECCRALYHLTSDNEANRQRVNSSSTNNANVIDTLTSILASNDEAVFNEEVKVWAKKAMEALFTSSQA